MLSAAFITLGYVGAAAHPSAFWGSGRTPPSRRSINASNMTFNCRFVAGSGGTAGDVMLLHGFPEWSSMWEPLMQRLAEKGHRSVACDQRGYSAEAAPDVSSAYNYNRLREDIWAVADAVGFTTFHLVAHNHGAVLGWYTAGSAEGKRRLRSVSSLAVPHTDAFSEGLSDDVQQQMASQYFSIFTLEHSAFLRGRLLYWIMGLPAGFLSAGSFQKALWWYNGAMDVGVMARPPVISADVLKAHGYDTLSWARWLYGGAPDEGAPQKVRTGDITMPALFVCGTTDAAILCDRPFALKTEKYCTGRYRYMKVRCGHQLTETCAEKEKVYSAIIDHITSADVDLTPIMAV